jgi:hypothetical protein
MRLRSDEAMWVVPSRGVHTFGLRFPIDVIYLDDQNRVIHLVENLGPLRIAPLRWQAASVLELPALSICGSGTQVGDQIMISSPERMEEYLASNRAAAPPRKQENSGVPPTEDPMRRVG